MVATAVRLPLAHGDGECERVGVCETEGLAVEHDETEGERDTVPAADVGIAVFDADEQPETVSDAVGERDGDGEPVPVMYCVVATGVALTLEQCEEERDCVGERVTDAQPLNDSEIVLQALAVEERLGEPEGEEEPVTV